MDRPTSSRRLPRAGADSFQTLDAIRFHRAVRELCGCARDQFSIQERWRRSVRSRMRSGIVLFLERIRRLAWRRVAAGPEPLDELLPPLVAIDLLKGQPLSIG